MWDHIASWEEYTELESRGVHGVGRPGLACALKSGLSNKWAELGVKWYKAQSLTQMYFTLS